MSIPFLLDCFANQDDKPPIPTTITSAGTDSDPARSFTPDFFDFNSLFLNKKSFPGFSDEVLNIKTESSSGDSLFDSHSPLDSPISSSVPSLAESSKGSPSSLADLSGQTINSPRFEPSSKTSSTASFAFPLPSLTAIAPADAAVSDALSAAASSPLPVSVTPDSSAQLFSSEETKLPFPLMSGPVFYQFSNGIHGPIYAFAGVPSMPIFGTGLDMAAGLSQSIPTPGIEIESGHAPSSGPTRNGADANGDKKSHSKRFICSHPGCGRAFARNYNLGTHMATHTGKKDFACPCCSKKFSRKHDLGRHLQALHFNSGQPVVCLCGQTLADVNAFQKHKCKG